MDKSPDAFRTISEVAEDLDVPQHVLRFWETRFAHIKPLKRGGGRRYYRPDDVDLLKGIRHLLYGEGYTIKGVQRILKEDGVRFVQSVGRGEAAVTAPQAHEREEEYPAETYDAPGSVPASAAAPLPNGGGHGPQPGLNAADLKLLRAAFDELAECERVLSGLKAPAEAGASE
ncbi:MerR family transcriptional regulator [Microvirga flavescens]|uniref:MerR family transcriptional regulator n=1 Tax=Microvirga flavescens TaxID=2249811 RepID=UPI000DD52E78|nr:MerR family transcriptional regulator [Microvirga flavescens]